MSYYGDTDNVHDRSMHGNGSTEALYRNVAGEGMRSRVQLSDEVKPVRHLHEMPETRGGLGDRKPQLSWFLTLTVLTVVTVVRCHVHLC